MLAALAPERVASLGQLRARVQELAQGALGARHSRVAEAAPLEVGETLLEVDLAVRPQLSLASGLELPERSLQQCLRLGRGPRPQQAEHHAVRGRELRDHGKLS